MKLLTLKQVLGLSILLFLYQNALACEGVTPCCPPPCPWYGIVGGGYAWSTNINPTINFQDWDPAVEGYNSNVDNSPFYTLGVGKRLSRYFLAEVTSSYFNDFQYVRHQTSSVADTPGFTGTSRVRYFDLTNLNFMFNVLLNNPCFGLRFNQMTISPFIGGGAGVAINTIKDFHTLTGAGTITTVGLDSPRTTSFAAQGESGLAFNFTSKLGLNLGYRYYYGGRFRGPDKFFITTGETPVTLPGAPWKGSLKANLVFAELHVAV